MLDRAAVAGRPAAAVLGVVVEAVLEHRLHLRPRALERGVGAVSARVLVHPLAIQADAVLEQPVAARDLAERIGGRVGKRELAAAAVDDLLIRRAAAGISGDRLP